MIDPEDILPFPLSRPRPHLDSFHRPSDGSRCWFVQVQGPIPEWDVAGPGHDTAIEAITAWNLGMRKLQGP